MNFTMYPFTNSLLKKGILWIRRMIFGPPPKIYYQQSYAQEGEDLFLNRLFEDKVQGFYVDIGAHHPKRFSNTYFFYLKNWRGINIDAMPGSMDIFRRERPNDINLEVAIMGSRRHATYFQFNEPALNGFSRSVSMARNGLKNYQIINQVAVEGFPLSGILDEHLPPGVDIDFLSIDVEGLDFEVIKSNNWKIYRPKVVLVEILEANLEIISTHEIYRFMRQVNYQLHSKMFNTVFFVCNEYLEDEKC